MAIGILTGSGTYALPGFAGSGPEAVWTKWGPALVSRGSWGGVEVLHVSRHGAGHPRMSNHVTHRANIAALKQLGATGVLAVTVCGAVDPAVELGSLVCFDDLHFLVNRLPDGSICTFYDEPGAPERGHWIYEGPFSGGLRGALLAGAREAGVAVRDGGVYGHVDAVGVTAVSQTAGPETVLCGEAELPYALLGFMTDYANGVKAEATPVSVLVENMARSTDVFARVLAAALPHAAGAEPAGEVYRFTT
jgi:purine nucleoside phosphorylase